MIIFDLICEHDHRFEGWFHSPQDFHSQCERGLVQCPQCSTPLVRKVPSAVAIATSRGDASGSQLQQASADPAALPMTPTQAFALYRQFMQAVSNLSEDVGPAFAEEARRMHYRQAPERLIRGQTTDAEYAELQDEGIEVMRLPVIRDEDLN